MWVSVRSCSGLFVLRGTVGAVALWCAPPGRPRPGRPHPALKNRLGDYVLFAAPGHAFLYPAACSSRKHAKYGNHGGLSADELDVPLFVVTP